MTDTIIEEFDAATALRLLREAVEERGSDFKYYARYGKQAGCDYTAVPSNDDPLATDRPIEPACIIGVALFKAGWDLQRLNGLAGDINELVDDDVLACTPLARAMWEQAQYLQDQDSTWGEALESATEIYNARRGEE